MVSLSANEPRGAPSPGRSEGMISDRKSTRLNSSHSQISYAVFCLKKKIQSAKFLQPPHIYRTIDLTYQSQIVAVAAILADIGDAWEHEPDRAKIVRSYWHGGLGQV